MLPTTKLQQYSPICRMVKAMVAASAPNRPQNVRGKSTQTATHRALPTTLTIALRGKTLSVLRHRLQIHYHFAKTIKT